MVHLDAAEIAFVYGWRKQQERALVRARGQGMTDGQVERFVDACTCPPPAAAAVLTPTDMPAYHMYVPALRRGALRAPGKQLRLVLDRERRLERMEVV